MIRGFLFDLDGIVIDSEKARDDVTSNMLLAHGVTYDRDLIKPKLTGKSSLDGTRILVEHYKLQVDPADLDRSRREEIKRLYRDEIQFIPGFIDFFQNLTKTFPVPYAVATGCDREFYEQIDKRLQLTNLFANHVYNADQVPRGKPAPDIFQLAAKSIDVPIQDCVVFEDAPNGVAASIRAGVRKTVILAKTYTREIMLDNLQQIMRRQPSDEEILFIDDYTADLQKVVSYIKSE